MIKRFFKKWYVKWPLRIGGIAVLLFAGLIASVYVGFWGPMPSKKQLSDLSQAQASLLFDRDSVLIGKLYQINRESISFEDLPQSLINALVATEDSRFFEHNGIDERSMFRVFFKTILMGDASSGGGSTITQQLVKNYYGRKNYGKFGIVINKLRESIIATRIEEVYSKNEILTLYLNTVPFSGNVYGIESAAQKFFNKKASSLTLIEAATLVGTLKANHYYNPELFPEHAKQRRNVVLNQMVKYGYLPADEMKVLTQKPLGLHYQNHQSRLDRAGYFKEQVRQQLLQILQKDEYKKPTGESYDPMTDGLRVYTTLDGDLQKYAEASMQQHLSQLQETVERNYGKRAPWKKALTNEIKQLPYYQQLKEQGLSEKQISDSLNIKHNRELFSWQGDTVMNLSTIDSLREMIKYFTTGMVSVDPNTGAVLAYIGGINFDFFKYDHVVQSKREVGSTFKPFVYTAAIENGMKPCKYFSLQKVTYTDQDGWTPENAEKEEKPYMNYSLEAALSHSVNTIAVKVLRETGIPKTIKMAHKMGIDEEIEEVPSIALGVTDISVINLAKAYTTYLNNGRPVEPYMIQRIEDKNGKVIYEKKPQEPNNQAYSEFTRQVMLEMLQDVVNNGTAQRLRSRYHLSNALAGKTGTTQNNTDGWFVGLMPHLVTVTWVGNDNHAIKFKSTRIGQGANSALPIFAGMVQRMSKDKKFNYITRQHFKQPSEDVLKALDCEPMKKDGLFKRIFKKKEKKRSFEKKKGFFQRLFGRKDEDISSS